jgi:hypothetical protein
MNTEKSYMLNFFPYFMKKFKKNFNTKKTNKMATNTIIKKKEGMSLQVKINLIKDVEKDVDNDVILQKI